MDFNINNMKKIITLALLMCTITLVKSQNNLVFNQTINLSLSPNQEITVPDGKTWKIEFANVNDPNGTNSFEIISPNTTGASVTNTVYTAGNNLNAAHLIWLKAGSRVKARGNSLFLSALEFNVVPLSSSSNSDATAGFTAEGLEFNKVINIQEQVTTDNYGTIVGSFEIPEGKVWKITKATLNLARDSQSYYLGLPSNFTGMFLGEIMIFQTLSPYRDNSFPIWINSGTKELVIRRSDNSGLTPLRITISAIEYNIPE